MLNVILTRVQFDDGLFVNDRSDLLTRGNGKNLSLEIRLVKLHPYRQLSAGGGLNAAGCGIFGLRVILDSDDIADIDDH